MKIVFFTTGGPFGLRALECLARDHEVLAVVQPDDPAPFWKRVARIPARWVGLRHRDVVDDWRRGTAIPSIAAARGEGGGLADKLALLGRPDLICIVTFPWLLSPEILAVARHGVVNLHPSYLPRHRGPNPLFWTYYHSDRTGGVSVHMADRRADAGPILAQERIDIPRGWSSGDLYLAMSRAGAHILHSAVESIERGTARPVDQADSLSTQAPRLEPGRPMIDFTSWDVERTWHFLAGLNPWYKEPLTTPTGRLVRYGAVVAFVRGPSQGRTGHVRPTPNGWALTCRDGEVHLGPRSTLPTRVRHDPGSSRTGRSP